MGRKYNGTTLIIRDKIYGVLDPNAQKNQKKNYIVSILECMNYRVRTSFIKTIITGNKY
jgi:hypothetical protein